MNEINESVLDQEKKELSSEIFISGKEVMKGTVKNFIVDNIYRWLKSQKYEKEVVKEIILIGSIAGYHYNDTADVDVSIRTSIPDDWIKKNWSLLPNGHNIPNTKHPVNYYLTTNTYHQNDIKDADAAYDILNDKWIKKEDKGEEIPYPYAVEVAKFFAVALDDRMAEYERDKIELESYKKLSIDTDEITQKEIDEKISLKEMEVKADLQSIKLGYNLIKGFRKEAFTGKATDILLDIKVTKKNSSLNNIIYKILEKWGYFEKVEKIKI